MRAAHPPVIDAPVPARALREKLRADSSVAALTARRLEVHSLHFTVNQALKNSFSVWIVAFFVIAVGWQQLPHWLSVGWLLAVGGAFTLRTRYLRAGRALENIERDPALWRFKLNVSTALCGLVVGSAPLLMFASIEDSARMYLSMIFCSWLAGAMSSLGARTGLYVTYAAILAVGVAAGWLVVGAQNSIEICAMLLLFVVVTSSFSWSFAAQVNEGFEIRYANEQLVESLKLARAAAEESSAAKSRFLAVASHDLRQPLHAVTLLNGLLVRPQTPEKITEISRQMSKALTALEHLFNSVLDFSRLEADKVKAELAWHSLDAIFTALQASYEQPALLKGLRLEFRSNGESIRTDAALFERILRNLIENALKFTDQGSVAVTTRWVGGHLAVSVSDTGPGIAPYLKEEIFKEYFQANTGKAGIGLGLGLAIVRGLSDLLGFQVQVEEVSSELAQGKSSHGSTFSVLVPAAMVRGPQHAPPSGEGALPSLPLNGLLVAYVDDDAASRDALALLLDDWGCRAVVSETLTALMLKLGTGPPPDALLTDFSLAPGVSGLDVIAAVRGRFGPVSAAILTGDISAIEIEKLGELEYPVLCKPVSAQELRALLEVFKNIG